MQPHSLRKAMVHLSSDPLLKLPTAEELPHSDDTPVDNELQNDIPNFILNLLRLVWEERQDWFFGVDMAIHYKLHTPAIVPDGFCDLAKRVGVFIRSRGKSIFNCE
nr:hypothetical protein [Pseudanabaena sp. PCC 6802]